MPEITTLTFFITGIPKPQSRPKFARAGGFVKTYSPKTNWYEICYAVALQNRPEVPFDGPISVGLSFALPRPKSAPKRVVWPAVRPDLDNYEKAMLDALTQAGIWKDDGLICDLHSVKFYAEGCESGCRVLVEPLSAPHNKPIESKVPGVPDLLPEPIDPAPGYCRCGTKKKVCAMCGSQYCPKCDEYHLENCRDQMKGGE